MNQERSVIRLVLKDFNLIVGANQTLVVGVVLLAFIVLPAAANWREHRIASDHEFLLNHPVIQVIEGEKPTSFRGEYSLLMDDTYFNRRCLSYWAERADESHFLFIHYPFVVEPGIYKIFAASSPPGSMEEKGPFASYSPYEVLIDGGEPILISSETIRNYLLRTTGSEFYTDYTYASGAGFTKIGEFELSGGRHEIAFLVRKGSRARNRLFFRLDAIFIVPKDWKPEQKFLTFPDDLFSY